MKQLIEQLFTKPRLQDTPVEDVTDLVREYPFFSAGQFFLAKKLKAANDPDFQRQFQKTLLYFHNPLWLDYQLTDKSHETDEEKMPEVVQQTTSFLDAPSNDSSHDMLEQVVTHQEIVAGTPGELVDIQMQASAMAEERDKVLTVSGREASDTVESVGAAGNTYPEPAQQEAPAAESADNRQTVQREEPFTFQAYHTVDYFASQGIKLSTEGFTGDKLGKQLKSFTEWLKTMRRLPEAAAEEALEKLNDTEIVKHAAHSLEENEVVTEAMAEVFLKQGKIDKAAEVYRKLSLTNPQKSDYFAARIADFKHS